MGSRHQLFIIARVNGRYRGLAVVHHQILSGERALEACLRLLKTFEAPENRLAISHEVRWAETLSTSDWESKDAEYIPFPFIHTCLSTASSYDEAKPFYHMVHRNPFNLAFNGGDNNDGITVLDITYLDAVRYAFVNWHSGFGDEYYEDEYDENYQEPKPYGLRPLSAAEYLKPYCREQDFLASKSLIEGFERWPLIDSDTLASAWPEGRWESGRPGRESTEQASTSQSTLRTAAMAQFLNEALSSSVDDLPAILESAKQLTDFWPTLKMKLYAEPELVSNSPAACHLLASAFEHDSVVDLSPFTLSIEGIERILLLKSHLKSLTTLSLSGNQFVDEITLQEILTKYPGLRILQLLNTPQLKLETKVAMARTANQLQILDTELLALPFRDDNHSEPYNYIDPPLMQIMVVVPQDTSSDRTPGGGLYVHKIMKLLSNSPFSFSLPFPLTNMNLPSTEFLIGLTKFLRFYSCAGNTSFYMEPLNDIGRALAFSFASAVDFKYGLRFKAGTLSQTLYPRLDINTKFLYARQGLPRPQKLAPGEWSLLFIAEPWWSRDDPTYKKNYPSAVRYAFISVTPVEDTSPGQEIPPTKVVRADFETYLNNVIKDEGAEATRKYLLDGWKKLLDNLKPDDPEYRLGLCDTEEVESYLRSENYTGVKTLEDSD